jgi:hypothetical protein
MESFTNNESPRGIGIRQGRKVMDAVGGEEQTVFVIVAAEKFAQLLPTIMIQETIPAGIAGLSVVSYGRTPPEFDLKL